MIYAELAAINYESEVELPLLEKLPQRIMNYYDGYHLCTKHMRKIIYISIFLRLRNLRKAALRKKQQRRW